MTKTSEKATGAFRTIREVADWLTVPTHVLRFWESKFDHIAPVKGAGGRRYYRPEDMRLLGGIKVMLHDQGLTIRGVGQKINEEGLEPIMALSPELAAIGTPPQRTRRVIRPGEEEERRGTSPNRTGSGGGPEAKPQPDAPVEEPGAPSGPPPEPQQPVDAPVVDPDPDAPSQPDLPIDDPEAPGEPVRTRVKRDLPDEKSDADMISEPEAAPQPGTPRSGSAASLELPPLSTRTLPPALEALRRLPSAAPTSDVDRRRLRRVVRRLRNLVDEIQDELEAE